MKRFALLCALGALMTGCKGQQTGKPSLDKPPTLP